MDFSSVQLRKTQTKETQFDINQHFETLKRNKEIAEQTNVDRWYEALSDILVPAHIVDISVDQGKAIKKIYDEKVDPAHYTVDERDRALLQEVAELIDAEAEKAYPGCLEKGFFIRLNTRSPKDARMFSDIMKEAVERDERLYTERTGKEVDLNAKLGIVYVNMVKSMVVHSGEEAVDLLGNSHRIWQDISSALDTMIGDDFSIKLVIREWAEIHPSTEFRGFVYNKNLNAISSYNRIVCWEGVPEKKEEYKAKMMEYWENEVKHRIPDDMSNFIIDFAFLEDTGEITIVELNDFNDFEGCGAHAELFDWQSDSDVLRGNAPFEMRIVEQPCTREELEQRLTKPFRVWLGWETMESWNYGVDYY